MGENEPRWKSWFDFRDVLAGIHTSRVPAGGSPSPNPSSSKNEPPTSLWKGEGRMRLGCVCASWWWC